MIIAQTQREGLSEEAARQKVFMVDRFGLLTDKMPNLLPFQTKLVQKRENLSDWDTDSDVLSLLASQDRPGCLRKRSSVKCINTVRVRS